MSFASRTAALVLGWLSLTGGASVPRAQPATAPAERPPPTITRADLVRAYLCVERALQEHPPADPKLRAAAHAAMDKAAYEFFTADHVGAIRTMNELTDTLRSANADDRDNSEADLRSTMQSLKISVAPRVANVHRPSIFNVRFVPMYPRPIPEPIDARLVVRGSEGKIVFEQPIRLSGAGPMPSISARQPDAAPGEYVVQIVGPHDEVVDVSRWYVTDELLDTKRQANERRLIDVDAREYGMFQALVALRSRNALLTDRPGEGEASLFLANPVELSKQVEQELEALLAGKNPYRGRIGDYYRAIPAGAMQIPARVYAPEQIKQGKPMPLVIALHGAGADENAFFEGYGAGAIKRLADEHGFVVVAPSTYWVMPNPNAFTGIVDAMSVDYPIDPQRICIVGHSLGAMAGYAIAARHPDELAGAALIAGGKFAPSSPMAPLLIIAGELDPVIPPHHLEGAARRAQENGLPVEFRLIRASGHILVANEALGEAIDWLLKRKRAAAED